MSANAIIGCAAAVGAAVLLGLYEWRSSSAVTSVRFSYASDAAELPADAARQLGGGLTRADIARIEHISRGELQGAFATLRVAFTDRSDAFWRIEVVRRIQRRRRLPLPLAGEALPMGPLGGRASVDFQHLALNAIHYAPPGASRAAIVDAMGRGIGRTAAHELAHLIAGVYVDDERDALSYEYHDPNRAAQYYGELHWNAVWPMLQARIGTRR